MELCFWGSLATFPAIDPKGLVAYHTFSLYVSLAGSGDLEMASCDSYMVSSASHQDLSVPFSEW